MFNVDYEIKVLVLPLPPCRAVTRSAGLHNETDLHNKVVEYLRSRYPHANIVPGLGEFQDSSWKRCNGYRKGYSKGQPDLLILNQNSEYAGLCFELKTPSGRGVFRNEQREWLEKLALQNFKCFVSNSYEDITRQIDLYFSTCKALCPVCCKWLNVWPMAAHTCAPPLPAAGLPSERERAILPSPSTVAISIQAAAPPPEAADLPQSVLSASYAGSQSSVDVCADAQS